MTIPPLQWTPKMVESAKALPAHPGWTWMPGMAVEWDTNHQPHGAGSAYYSTGRLENTDGHGSDWQRQIVELSEVPVGAFPDIRDPATVGCMATIGRRLWNRPDLVVTSCVDAVGDITWGCALHAEPYHFGQHDTEGEAWTSVILAALVDPQEG